MRKLVHLALIFGVHLREWVVAALAGAKRAASWLLSCNGASASGRHLRSGVVPLMQPAGLLLRLAPREGLANSLWRASPRIFSHANIWTKGAFAHAVYAPE
jgi:hypothetical protein